MRKPLGEWADQEIEIKEDIIPVEDKIDIPPYPGDLKNVDKEDIYDEKQVTVKEVVRPETEEERITRLKEEYARKKTWGKKG